MERAKSLSVDAMGQAARVQRRRDEGTLQQQDHGLVRTRQQPEHHRHLEAGKLGTAKDLQRGNLAQERHNPGVNKVEKVTIRAVHD